MPVSVNDLNQEPSKGHMPRPAGGTSRARLNLAHEQRCPTSISRRFSLSHSSSWNVDRQRLIVANEVARARRGDRKPRPHQGGIMVLGKRRRGRPICSSGARLWGGGGSVYLGSRAFLIVANLIWWRV